MDHEGHLSGDPTNRELSRLGRKMDLVKWPNQYRGRSHPFVGIGVRSSCHRHHNRTGNRL